MFKRFFSIVNIPPLEENRLKGLGLHRSTLMLNVLTIELLLKSLALNLEREKIDSGEIKTFQEFLKVLKTIPENSDGHRFKPIIAKFGLKFSDEEIFIINSLQDFTV